LSQHVSGTNTPIIRSTISNCLPLLGDHTWKGHNTIAQLTKPARDTTPSFPCDKSGVYAISCVTCGKSYVEQTSRSLNLCFKEHTLYIRFNNPLSAYALHILQNQHKNGPINQTMTLLKPIANSSLLTPFEQYFIQSFGGAHRLIPEQNTGEPNPLFQLAFDPCTPS
jgi:hypothetical protein